MIFSLADHIQQIIQGRKTQTRRKSGSYLEGHTYSIQPKRRAPSIPEGRILITEKRLEQQPWCGIIYGDALAEGGYTPEEFETLYSRMYPDWRERYAYTFKQKDAQRKRVKYWFTKCVNAGLIPHTLDTEDQLRQMFKEWKEAQGQPIIPDIETARNGSETTEKQGTTVPEFYQMKKSFEKGSDSRWVSELQKGEGSGVPEAPHSHRQERIERIRAGESSLIFDRGVHKTFPLESDSDKYLSPERVKAEKKKKSAWNF